MEAGRELDALVAEKVMGWCSDAFGTFLYPPDRIECPDRFRCPFFDKETPGFSTDVGIAWGIAKKLVGDGFSLSIHESTCGPEVGFFRRGNCTPGDTGLTYGSTISHAICLAALKAVGVDTDNL